MADLNTVICTSVSSARLEVLTDEEARRLSCCRIVSSAAFATLGQPSGPSGDAASTAPAAAAAAAAAAAGVYAAVPGGVHDARLGVFDGRDTCKTCGLSGTCTGHLGHIELELPAFQPLFLPSLVKILKGVCFECRRLRLPKQQQQLEAKRFQLLQQLLLQQLPLIDSSSTSSSGSSNGSKKREQLLELFAAVDRQVQQRMSAAAAAAAAAAEPAEPSTAAAATADAATADAEEQQQQGFLLQHLAADLSSNDWRLAAWRQRRQKILALAAAAGRCAHCGTANAVSVHLGPKGSGVELRWGFDSVLPYTGSSLLGCLFAAGGADADAAADETSNEAKKYIKPDDACLKYSQTNPDARKIKILSLCIFNPKNIINLKVGDSFSNIKMRFHHFLAVP